MSSLNDTDVSDSGSTNPSNLRAHPRRSVPAMYSLVRVKPKGAKRYPWTGYVYDVSLGGMRFELDDKLEPGTEVEVRAMIPFDRQMTINATGTVVRMHDDSDEVGPVRMGLNFTEFKTDNDRRKVDDFVNQRLSGEFRKAA